MAVFPKQVEFDLARDILWDSAKLVSNTWAEMYDKPIAETAESVKDAIAKLSEVQRRLQLCNR